MNVYIFPTLPYPTEGYSIAVCSDLKHLDIKGDDLVLWYNLAHLNKSVDFGLIIEGSRKISTHRFLNLLQLRPSTDMTMSDVKGIRFPEHPKMVFCGDTIIYNLLRKIYPHEKMVVRFHNCYLRIANRMDNLYGSHAGINFKITLKVFAILERKIFNDINCHKIFISEEDRSYYSMITGRLSDSEVWGFSPNMELVANNKIMISRPQKIIWFGGIHAHKSDSVKWFITDVFSRLQSSYPQIEFHLYGNNTEAFNDPSNNIFGHGRYDGDSLPDKTCAIYVNPDISGGGVKIKLLQYFEEGVTFITTPFGKEGYSQSLFDNKTSYCVQQDEWYECLYAMFANSFDHN